MITYKHPYNKNLFKFISNIDLDYNYITPFSMKNGTANKKKNISN